MSIQISHLRRWFAGGAIGLLLVVTAVYFYARHRVENALKEVPTKIGIEIQQSAKGFTVSRSEQGHTIFKIEASKAVQYKQGGHAELHDVTITLYGAIPAADQIMARILNTIKPAMSSAGRTRWTWR
jgi:lipopolysaccharide export system protein LptA